MKLNYVGQGIQVNDKLREVADKKFSKLEKYFRQDIEGKVTFRGVKNDKIVEVQIILPDGAILRAEEATDDIYTSIDKVLQALERQIRKHKTKLRKRYSSGETIRFDHFESEEREDEEDRKVVKVKKFDLKPMTEEEAILQMDLLGHNFFVFLDGQLGRVRVVYRRNDGHYGIIDPQVKA